jgi:hypothetical protein
LVEYGLHEIIRVVVGGKEISHVAVAENAALDWICSAERSWVVGLYHVAVATETVRVISHTHPPAGEWMMRSPGTNKEMKWGVAVDLAARQRR